jgi:hypothetical protein
MVLKWKLQLPILKPSIEPLYSIDWIESYHHDPPWNFEVSQERGKSEMTKNQIVKYIFNFLSFTFLKWV